MKMTVAEIADALGVNEKIADGVVKFLVVKGLAQFKGERPSPTGRGKGPHVYEVVAGASEGVAATIRLLEE